MHSYIKDQNKAKRLPAELKTLGAIDTCLHSTCDMFCEFVKRSVSKKGNFETTRNQDGDNFTFLIEFFCLQLIRVDDAVLSTQLFIH